MIEKTIPMDRRSVVIHAPIVGAAAAVPTNVMHAVKNTVAVDHSLLARVENKFVCDTDICSFARTHACILSPPTLPYAHCLAPQTAKLPSARAAFRLPPARPLIFPFAVRLCARLFARYGTSIGLLVSSFPLTVHSK